MLTGKTVLLGVTGSIAAYKAATLCSLLKKQHANVHVLMTQNVTQFVHPITFETLSGNKCLLDTFDRNFQYSVEHVALAKQADLVMIAPATANVLAKLAHGIADDMLTTTTLACGCKKMVAPAMNTGMYENPITQENLAKLVHHGVAVVEPNVGLLACGDVGKGKMAEPEQLLQGILQEIAYPKDLAGKRILVTAGATQEPLDPVRYLTNHSTGKMGYALATAAARRGAAVTLVSGKTALEQPPYVDFVSATTAQEMFEAVKERYREQDIIIKAAAVADYTPVTVAPEKLKKSDRDFSLPLKRTTDILAWLGANKQPNQLLCGFAMETEQLLENAKRKLEEKQVDMICANSLRQAGAGFGVDTNVLTLLTKTETISLPQMTKEEAAHQVLNHLLQL